MPGLAGNSGSEPAVAGCAVSGLSRRRSRVRVPSLPPLEVPVGMGADDCVSSPASVSAEIDALARNPRCAAGWNSTSSTWSWRRTPTPYASLVDGCTAEERHSRPGQGIVGHLVSGPPLVGTAGEQRPRVTLPRRCRRPLRIRLRQPRRGRLVSARIYVNGRRVRTVRGRRLPAPIQLVRLPRGRVRVMIVARTSTGRTVVHAALSDVRALSTERRGLSQAAPLSRLRGQMRRKEQS